MSVTLTEQLSFYRSRPPSALNGLHATVVEEIAWVFDGHGSPVNAVFALACPCGSKLFNASCAIETIDDEPEVSAPIAIACDACEADYDIFDPSEHGWNAVMCGDKFEDPDMYDVLEGVDVEAPHEIVVRFEYGRNDLGNAELAGREQEVFSWFTLLARDAETQELEQLFEWECA